MPRQETAFSDGASSPPKPRNIWLPTLFVLLAMLAVAGTVLSANGGRNMLALAKAFNIPLPRQETLQPTATMPEPHAADPKVWPWIQETNAEPSPYRMKSPKDMCRDLTSAGQELPSFTSSGESGWECSILVFDRPEDASSSSLFLLARGGKDAASNVVRVKFNLADGQLAKEMAERAVSFVRDAVHLRPDEGIDEELMRRLSSQADFYFIAGYDSFIFRRELDDANRYNLITFNRASSGPETPLYWPKPGAKALDKPAIQVLKGSRLTALTSGSD